MPTKRIKSKLNTHIYYSTYYNVPELAGQNPAIIDFLLTTLYGDGLHRLHEPEKKINQKKSFI